MYRVLDEDATLDAALAGRSIARYGDGELRIVTGRGCSSQRPNANLSRELRDALATPSPALICVPRMEATPRQKFWTKYAAPEFTSHYRLPEYGSAFITRPDNAPNIDRPDYWEKVQDLWRGKKVILISSLRKDVFEYARRDADSFLHIWGPEAHGYDEVERLDRAIGSTDKRVLLCLGACATALAVRFAKRGIHALDIGHIGMFMRRRKI